MKKNTVKKIKVIFLLLIVLNFSLTFLLNKVSAQEQSTPFSANSPTSYQCFDKASGNLIIDQKTNEPMVPDVQDSSTGIYYCDGVDTAGNAITHVQAYLKPVNLQYLEILFVKILYAIWALAAALSFIFLVALGYQYLLRGGTSDEELVKLRKRIINFIGGFILVFLAVPILTTVFRLLGVDTSVQCYNVAMPGFKFFYPSLCTDPNSVLAGKVISDPCTYADRLSVITGVLCSKDIINKYNAGNPLDCQQLIGNGHVNYDIGFFCKNLNQQNGSWCYEQKYCPTSLGSCASSWGSPVCQ